MIKVDVLTIFFLIFFVVKLVKMGSCSEVKKSEVTSYGVDKRRIKHEV